MPAHPMATSVSPRRHGRPKVSDTITATSTSPRARMPSRMRRAERSESSGSSAAQPSSTFDRSIAGVGADEPVLGLADDEVAAAAEDPHRLPLDDRLVRPGVVGVDPLELPLGLGDDLLGHDDDVAVGQRGVVAAGRGLDDHPGEVVAGRDLGHPEDREHLEARHATAASTPAARRGGDVGVAHDRVGARRSARPSASTAAASSASASSIDQGRAPGAVEPGHADDRGLVARARRAAGRPGPSSAAPATMGETATTRLAPGLDGVADAGHGEHRADRDDRVRRRDDDDLGRGDAPRARRAPAAPPRPRRSAPPSRRTSWWRPTKYSGSRPPRSARRWSPSCGGGRRWPGAGEAERPRARRSRP